MRFLRDLIIREGHSPSFLGVFVNPFYFARRELFTEVKVLAAFISGRVLDVGCGTKPYESLFSTATEYVGLEIDSELNRQRKNADYFYDGKVFPFGDASFDSVVINQVFEHVFEPEEFLSEISRVLVQDGTALVTVPFVWDEHEQPCDFARYTSFGLKAIFERHGFEVVEQRKTAGDVRVLFQMINAYLFKATVSRRAVVNLLSCLVLMAPFNLLGTLLYRVLPKNPDLYLDNVIVVRKVARV